MQARSVKGSLCCFGVFNLGCPGSAGDKRWTDVGSKVSHASRSTLILSGSAKQGAHLLPRDLDTHQRYHSGRGGRSQATLRTDLYFFLVVLVTPRRNT